MRRGTILAAVVGLAAVVAAALFGQRLLLRAEADEPRASGSLSPPSEPEPAAAPEADAAAPSEPAAAPVTLTVQVAGGLERLDDDGTWWPVSEGAALVETDRVRTRGEGSATIRASDGSTVELVDEVEVSVAALTRSLAEFDLASGRLRADLSRGSGLALRVRSAGAVAEGRSGAFTIYADGEGMVAVASETAAVTLRAQDSTVTLEGGQQAVVQPGAAPGAPEEIPDDVFLAVSWPEERMTRERRIRVEGRVRPGSEVRVAGHAADVRPDGAFSADLVLDAGPNRLEVSARDPAGRVRSERGPAITVRDRPPRLEPIRHGLWDD